MKRLMKFALSICLLGVCWLGAQAMGSQEEKNPDHLAGQSGIHIPELSDFTAQRLALQPTTDNGLTTTVMFGGVEQTLELESRSLRSDSFQLLLQGEDGELRRVAPPPSRSYRGRVEGVPGSRVAASLLDGALSAVIVLPEGPTWTIQPLSDFQSQNAKDRYLIYRSQDFILPTDYRCGTTELDPLSSLDRLSQSAAGIAETGLKIADIAFDVDFDFFIRRGRDVARTVSDIETVMNGVETIYEEQPGITYEISTIVIRTAEPDPYDATNAGALLDQFRSEWRARMGNIPRDVAHLITGQRLQSNVIGIAFLNTICNLSRGYGLSQSLFTRSLIFRVCLTAHELGHNWNAVHCDGDADCGIMCSGVGGCNQDCSNFGERALDSIRSLRNRSCLTKLPDPIDPPLFDDFPDRRLNTENWIFNNRVRVNSRAVDEPSAENSLNLNAAGRNEFQDDEIRSNFIRLGALTKATISFFTQHRGVEAGEALVVEYWSSDSVWAPLARVTSDGVDQDSFSFHSFTLDRDVDDQRDAFHDQFRIRFRTEVDQSNDNWYVDDVQVSPQM